MSTQASSVRAGPRRGLLPISIALAFTMVLPPASGAPLPRVFPFEDVNNNGVFDAGDREISAEIAAGSFTTDHSVVIPYLYRKLVLPLGLEVTAGMNLLVDDPMESNGTIRMGTVAGDVVIKRSVVAKNEIYLEAGGVISIADNLTLNSRGPVSVFGRDAMIGKNVHMTSVSSGFQGIYIGTWGLVTIGDNISLNAVGTITVSGFGDISVGKSGRFYSSGKYDFWSDLPAGAEGNGEVWFYTGSNIRMGVGTLIHGTNRVAAYVDPDFIDPLESYEISIGARSRLETNGDCTIWNHAWSTEGTWAKTKITLDNLVVASPMGLYVWGGTISFCNNLVRLAPKESCGIMFNDGVDQPFDLTGTRFQYLGDDDFKNW